MDVKLCAVWIRILLFLLPFQKKFGRPWVLWNSRDCLAAHISCSISRLTHSVMLAQEIRKSVLTHDLTLRHLQISTQPNKTHSTTQKPLTHVPNIFK